ncbi:MAG: folate/biopterin family MFS transporter [Nitrosomonas sp.]|nr:folate/biopterin family MFS transporter [Nitrosomonas sp.]
MKNWLQHLLPFKTAESQRLALLFVVVYFAQGMSALPVQVITISFKDQGLNADDIATFFLLTSIPWFLKPLYGLISDFLPLFGQHRKSYLLLTSALACVAGVVAGLSAQFSYWELAVLYTTMGLGLAYNDVLTDALMVENGKLNGLTGAFQSVQWSAVTAAAIVVGLLGGYFAEHRQLQVAFAASALFPLIVLFMAVFFVYEKPVESKQGNVSEVWSALRAGFGERSVWLVAAFIFLFNFSPSFGPAFLFYQTDELGFSQQYIGILNAVDSAASIIGALIYVPLTRSMPLRRLINLAIGLSVIMLLTYLAYRGEISALVIHIIWGITGMVTTLAFLDLAARACPPRAEATFFALLMAIFNLGTLASQNIGAHLYTELGEGSFAYTWLVIISTIATAAIWFLVPLIHIERIESRALQQYRTN